MVRRSLAAVLLLAAGCATYQPPSRTYDFDPTATYSGYSFDEVWDAVIDVFGEQSWPIDQFEKASGIITTDWLQAPDGWADCGAVTGSMDSIDRIVNEQVRFNIVVRDRDGGVTLRVNTTHRAEAVADYSGGAVQCISNGQTEELVHELVREALQLEGG